MIKSLYKTLLPGLVAVVLLGSVAFSVNTPVASAQESEQQIAEMIKQLQAQIEGRGYHVEIFNMDVSDSGPRGDHGEFDIDFRITAFTEDVFIPNSTARGRGSVGVIYEVVENGGRVVTTGQTMANLDSSVRRDGSRYRVNKGESVDFELVVEYQPEYTGTYTVRLRTVRPEGDVTTRMPDRDDRFEVKFITLKGSREITGQTGQESNDATIQRLQQQLQALIAQLTQMLANLQGTLNSLTMTVYPYNNSTDTFEARFDAGQSNTYSHYEIDWGEGDNSQQTVRSRVATVCNSQWTCTAPPGMIHTYVKSGMYDIRLFALKTVNGAKTRTLVATASARAGDANGGNTIQITSPNGGEQWEIGTMNTITWSPYGYNPNVNASRDVNVFLERPDGSTVAQIMDTGKASLHTYFNISDYQTWAQPGQYRVYVSNKVTGATDRSDALFTLLPRGVDIKVNGSDGPVTLSDNQRVIVSINTGANFSNCTLNGVRANPGGQPGISLGQASAGVASLYEGYAFAPTRDSSSAIYIECKKSDGSTRGDSVQVNMAGSAAVAALKVISPNGVEQIDPNKDWQIKVNISGLKSLSIALYKNDQWLAWIMKDVSTAGQPTNNFDWVHGHTPAAQMFPELKNGSAAIYKIYATGQKADGSGYVDDKSDAPFSFSGTKPPDDPTVPVITRIEPSVLVPGKMATIYGTNITFNISLAISGQAVGYVSYNTGRVEFTVPTNLPPGGHQLVITNKLTGASFTQSVEIGGSVPPTPSGTLSLIPCTVGLNKSTTDPNNSIICDQIVSWTTTHHSTGASGIKTVITGDFPYNSASFPNGYTAGTGNTGLVTF